MPRVQVNVSDEMKKYFEIEAKKVGTSSSALMAFAMNEFLENKKVALSKYKTK